MLENNLLAWLLDSDPAIRWQVLRDIAGARQTSFSMERKRIATHGWGARLLSYQDKNGLWGGQLYNNKWVSTTWSLLLLARMGLDPANPRANRACRALLTGGYQPEGAINFSKSPGRFDLGVNGIVLWLSSYFGCQDERVHPIAAYLLDHQQPDGRWEPVEDNHHLVYTFATTLLVLNGLHQYAQKFSGPGQNAVSAQERGREFLLDHRLFQDNDTGKAIDPKMTLFSFPPRWKYDVLTALDYFQECGATKDPRLQDAINLVQQKQRKNGCWNLQNRHVGKTFFEMEDVGSPSRWNTLRALRVLKWWES